MPCCSPCTMLVKSESVSQSVWPTLCHPMDYSWPVFYVYGILQTKILVSERMNESHSVVSDSLRPHRLHSPWNSPDQNTGVGSLSLLQGNFPTQEIKPGSSALQADSLPTEIRGEGYHSLLQGIFLIQGSNLGLLHCRQDLYHLSHQGRPLYYTYSDYQSLVNFM